MLVDPKWKRREAEIETQGKQLRADLTAMADYIRRHGWLQYMGGLPRRPRCISGVIYSVTGRWDLCHMRDRTAPIVAALGFADEAQLVGWNDAPERTKEQVLARIDAALL